MRTKHAVLCTYLFIGILSAGNNCHASFDWGSDCEGGTGEFSQNIAYQASATVGEIPVNKRNVRIELNSSVDVDIQLIDTNSGREIIAWPNGLLSGASEDTVEYLGLTYRYSGYNGVNGELGHEFIEISGDTNRTLTMKAFGYASGDANVEYSWSAVPSCNEVGAGSFSQYINKDQTVIVGDIPAGKTNIEIELKETSGKDVDVQLIDTATGHEIIAWPNGDLNGATSGTTTYNDMVITYSGYNGINGNLGWETIEISGTTTVELTMKAFGYASGQAAVSYEWGVGAGQACSATSPCGSGFVCKQGDSQNPDGSCHTETWCYDGQTAQDNCTDLPDSGVPGDWTCEEFQCVFVESSLSAGYDQACNDTTIICEEGLACTQVAGDMLCRMALGSTCGGFMNQLCGAGLFCDISSGSLGVCQADVSTDDPYPVDVRMIGEIINGKIHFCDGSISCQSNPARARLCPDDDADCNPAYNSEITWFVNGRPFSDIFLWAAQRPNGYSLFNDGGPAIVQAYSLRASNTTSAIVSVDGPGLGMSYYDVNIDPGQDYELNFDGSGYESQWGESHLYNHESYEVGFTHETLHADIDALVQELIDVTQAPHVRYQAFLMPTELAGSLGGEGNFSYGGGTVSVNYGNPPYLEYYGGAHNVIMLEMCHEYTHELFGVTLAPQLSGGYSCLNEGLADALGNHLGYVNNNNFGYEDGDGLSPFENGCTEVINESHHRGNCMFWHVKEAGYFTDSFFTNLFTVSMDELFSTGGSALYFNTCVFDDEQVGNIYVVLFSHAAGQDMSDVITATGLPNAGSLAAARAALGL